jgi:hypothetical protein
LGTLHLNAPFERHATRLDVAVALRREQDYAVLAARDRRRREIAADEPMVRKEARQFKVGAT